jgi:protein-S-isoprenylcysteine O-methyltransferase Ste14
MREPGTELVYDEDMSRAFRVVLAICAVLVAAGLALLFYYQVSGSSVDEDGWLVEQFWALALGTISIFVGSLGAGATLLAMVFSWRWKLRSTAKNDEDGSAPG